MNNDDLLKIAKALPGGQDLADAIEGKGIEMMTYGELGEAMGVTKKENGYDSTEFYNACLNCQSNPKIKALPREERLRVIKTAAAALDSMYSR